jgi:hypothetical protein
MSHSVGTKICRNDVWNVLFKKNICYNVTKTRHVQSFAMLFLIVTNYSPYFQLILEEKKKHLSKCVSHRRTGFTNTV